ncbi:MAG: 1-deoxy-D-xylulose-5-phosphate reductoisomerase [Planctomycetaceae bacterium]|nr:1-deoxy-D-xylulose-5-phosphate reductoisomerase [Planctomycetaceae bacterium]
MKRVAVLGSTGSIGTSCLEVIGAHTDRLSAVGLTAHSSWQQLAGQSDEYAPRFAVLADDSARDRISPGAFPSGTEVQYGPAAIERLAASDEVDIVISGIVGAAGLRGTWAAVEAGRTVGIANKETLVVAGPQVTRLAEQTGATLIPVDSEHSAVYQAMHSGRRSEVRRIVLTASGGPFRGKSRQELEQITPAQALDHPTWQMGPKITVDSATMMNKALEVIEARWLFGLEADQIEVVVHPQSVVHSFVEFVDGSVIAQLSPPDMKLPIQYALSWPERWNGISPQMDWSAVMQLDFAPPDREAFPALELGFEVARTGGTSGAVLNAANEVAVARFLAGDMKFNDIPRVCREVLDAHTCDPSPSLTELLRADTWAREETARW